MPMLGSGPAEPAECQPPGPDLVAAPDLIRAVLAHLHMHAYEFSVASCEDGERLPQRYDIPNLYLNSALANP